MLFEIIKENMLPEGFTTRPAMMNDIEAITDLLNTCAIAYIGNPDVTISDMTSFFKTPAFDLATNTRLVFTPDGKLVGYNDVDDTRPVPVTISIWGRTHPDYEGLGIGSTGITWAEARARQVIPRLPEDVRVVMTCFTLNTVTQATKLLQDSDMTLTRHFWQMKIELDKLQPSPVFPAGIKLISFAEFDDLTALYQAEVDVFKDHWGHVDEPENKGLERFRHWVENDEEFDPERWFLAMDGDEIAGLSLCRRRSYDDNESGWVNVLGVRRAWRRQGLALALLHHSFNVFEQDGKKRVGLGVDAGSLTGATRLYEKAGMHIHRQEDAYEKVLRDGKDLVKRSIEE